MTYFNELGQGRVGFKTPSGGGGGVDTDAQAFITAASITNTTQQNAIITLVTDLKGYGIWSKMKAIYPFVGGTAAQHRFNLKDPRAVDAAFYLTFFGGGTHSATGYLPNGNSYADTKLNPLVSLTSRNTHMSIYNRTQSSGNIIDIGSWESGTNYVAEIWRVLPGLSRSTNALQLTDGDRLILDPTITNIQAHYIFNHTSSTNQNIYRNSTKIIQSTNTTTTISFPNKNIYIGCLNVLGTNTAYSNRESALISIGDGLTDTESVNFYNSVQKYQTTLGRNVGTPIISDTDVQAFITAAAITDTTQQTAINALVTDLKIANIWTKMKALYPFVGGTAAQHRFNLKDPRAVDEAYYLTFYGGGTHSATGYLPNGNSYADTKLTPSVLSANSQHLSYYSRTQVIGSQIEIGANSSSSNNNFLGIYYNSTSGLRTSLASGTRTNIAIPSTNTQGFFISNRPSNTYINVWKNNSKLTTDNVASTGNDNVRMYVGAVNGTTIQYSTKESAFASIGDGLTDTEAAAFYNAVQAYQTTLGRAI